MAINMPETTPATVMKRSILKYLASIFDPLGFFAPTTLLAHLFLQELWAEKKDWDDSLSDVQQQKWSEIESKIRPIKELSFPRFIEKPPGATAELHIFCDASQKA